MDWILAADYNVRVAAMNAAGVGPITPCSQSPSEGLGLQTHPDRVIGVMVEPGDRSLMVTWDAPYAGHASLSIKEL